MSTNYDSATAILDDCAAAFASEAGSRVSVLLRPSHSLAGKIEQSLKNSGTVAFFFFGHGKLDPKGLYSQDRVAAIHEQNLDLLKHRLICATACYSLNILDLAIQDHSATVLGYAGALNLPLLPTYQPLFRDCLLTGFKKLLAGKSAQSACETLISEFEDIANKLIRGTVRDNVIASAVFQHAAKNVRVAGPDRTL